MKFGWTMFFQLVNTVLLIGFVYLIFNLIVKLPKRIKCNEEKIARIEDLLEEINRKLN